MIPCLFVALIYLSYIKKKMEDAGLFSRYTMHELLDELDVIECFQESGKAPIQGEILKKQDRFNKDLFKGQPATKDSQ